MRAITALNKFMKRYKFHDFKIVEGDLVFMHGEEGYGVEEFNNNMKMQKAWWKLQAKMVMTADQYRSRE